jgi:hypothetical protein
MRSASKLVARVAEDPALQAKIKEDPVRTLAGLVSESPLGSDVWIYRLVVGALGLAVLGCVAGAIVLAMAAKDTPQLLLAVGSAAVGALAGLLAPSPRGEE